MRQTVLFRDSNDTPRMRGWLLLITRVFWWSCIAFVLLVVVLSIEPRYNQYVFCARSQGDSKSLQCKGVNVEGIQNSGFPPQLNAALTVAIEILVALIFMLMAATTRAGKPDQLMTYLVALTFLGLGLTTSEIGNTLYYAHPVWQWGIDGLQALSTLLVTVTFCRFPNGRAFPRWTVLLDGPFAILVCIWLFRPDVPFNMIYGDKWNETPVASLALSLFIFGFGLYASAQRFHKATADQRSEMRWLYFAYGLILTVVVGRGLFEFVSTTPSLLFIGVDEFKSLSFYFRFALRLASFLVLSVVPIGYVIAIARNRNWKMEASLGRRMTYLVMNGILFALFIEFVVVIPLVLTQTYPAITGSIATIAAVLTTLVFLVVYRTMRRILDRLFFRERVDAYQSLSAINRDMQAINDVEILYQNLVQQATLLFHAIHGAMFSYNGAHLAHEPMYQFVLPQVRSQSNAIDETLHAQWSAEMVSDLVTGRRYFRPDNKVFPIAVPLVTPPADGQRLLGVLALGPRYSEQGYSDDDIELLFNLVIQTTSAIHAAKLRHDEMQRILAQEAHRLSPAGRAETMVIDWQNASETSLEGPLIELYALAVASLTDTQASETLRALPLALSAKHLDSLQHIAQGIGQIVLNRQDKVLQTSGLRMLAQLSTHITPFDSSDTVEANKVYSLYLHLLEADSTIRAMPAITEMQELQRQFHMQPRPKILDLLPVLSNLQFAEQSQLATDKLLYLEQAEEQLKHLSRDIQYSLGTKQ